MILEKLKKVKSFGSNMESSVTPEDIADKERELGFTLPGALKELYLTFHPDDPAFTEKGNLIPFGELKVYKRRYWTDTIITILPFCRYERYGYGFEVSRHQKSESIMSSHVLEDPQMWGLYVLPETRREEKHLEGREVPCNQSKLSQWIMEWLGYQQTLAQPSVVAVNRDKTEDYWKRMKEFFPNTFYHIPVEQLSSHRTNFNVDFTEEPSRLLCGSILYSRTACFGGRTDQELERLMKQMGFKYVWIKSQDGHPVFRSAPSRTPLERELKSITPVLQFLCGFAGIEGRGAKEESINRAEARLGNSLPLPMAEFYRYLPSRFYHSYNVIRPLSRLKQTKDGKMNFLEENQAMYHWAAEFNSPFLYRRINDGVDGWSAYGILDGFLAAEFLWALVCDEELALILWELPDFEPAMLSEGGKLNPYLSPIAGITDQIAAGNTRTLYQALDGQAVGLYDSEECTFWFATRNEEAQERLTDIFKQDIFYDNGDGSSRAAAVTGRIK